MTPIPPCPKAVPVPAEAAANATQQEDDENNDEFESDRHDRSSVVA